MNTLLLKLAVTTAVMCLLTSNPMAAQVSPTTPRAARVQITKGPEIELTKAFLTIIRWTTNNPGGSPRALRCRALWYRPQEPERDCEISHQVQPGPRLDSFPRAPGQPQAGD